MRALAIPLLLLATPAAADSMLRDFRYPHEVKSFAFSAQGQPLAMAYMDVGPSSSPNGKSVLLLHGKNFCGATWELQIAALARAGYRVVVPDQIGFCRSDKPRGYAYGLHELAANTRALLRQLGVERPIIVGHSMGGMLALRYGVSFPEDVGGLVLVNPIGLEDWRAKGVPERTLDELYAAEKRTTAEKIRAYQLKAYYDGQWKPQYDRWVGMLASMYEGPDGDIVAWAQAQTSRMVFSDPVLHDLGLIEAPTALLIGEKDTTAIGKDRVTPEVALSLGNYAELSRAAALRIQNARLVTFPDLGHSPHVQDPARFEAALLEALARM